MGGKASLVQAFISNLQPRPLAAMLKKRYLKDIHECMTVFLSLFMEGLKSKKSGSIFVKPSGHAGGSFRPVDRKVGKESAPVNVPVVAVVPTQGPSPHWGASKTCHHCGEFGHIRPDCPQRKATVPPTVPQSEESECD